MLNQEKHRVIMFQIINDIFDSDLKDALAFKWWTLAYFVYQLPRFSTDLDFDIIAPCTNIMEKIENIVKKYWTIKDKKDKQHTYFLLLDYWSDEHNIKIEISKKQYKNTEYEIVNFFWKQIRAMKPSSIFAHKLVALSERMKNRDLFDVDYFFKQWFPINKEIITERTGLTYEEFLENLSITIPQNFKPNTILAEIWDLISNKQKDFMKTKMVDEVLWFIKAATFNNNSTIKQWTIAFWIEANKLIYNDNKDSVIFTIDPVWWSILMNKDENNALHVAYVVLWKWRIDLNYDVWHLDSSIAHMIAFTWDINNKISLYLDWKLAVDKIVRF